MATGVELPGVPRHDPEVTRHRMVAGRFSGVDQGRALTWGLVTVVTLLGIGVVFDPELVAISFVFPLIVVSGLVLEPQRHGIVLAAAGAVVLLWGPLAQLSVARVVGVYVAVALVMAQTVVISRSRALVGTRGLGADRMFADLRDRIDQVGRVPALPAGWHASSSILSAHGDRFSGDFVIANLSPAHDRLQVALVDVSGKGTGAGVRSLLLSGALGGLLGSVSADGFLRAANDYLVRQGWDEGFATAVHLDLDLRTGAFSIGNAGHPAPALFTAGRGRWTVLEGLHGPLLGVVPDVDFPRATGRLDRGDALLVYSDGVIEARGRDLTDGVDRMLGVAAASVVRGGDIARDVCATARSGQDDDRSAFSVHRG